MDLSILIVRGSKSLAIELMFFHGPMIEGLQGIETKALAFEYKRW